MIILPVSGTVNGGTMEKVPVGMKLLLIHGSGFATREYMINI